MTPRLSELTPIIFNTELFHLGSEASIWQGGLSYKHISNDGVLEPFDKWLWILFYSSVSMFRFCWHKEFSSTQAVELSSLFFIVGLLINIYFQTVLGYLWILLKEYYLNLILVYSRKIILIKILMILKLIFRFYNFMNWRF